MASALHELRLDFAAARITAAHVKSAIDLGCGPGELLSRLAARSALERLIGIDVDCSALAQAGARCGHHPGLELCEASFTRGLARWRGVEYAALIETIEHIPAQQLGALEDAVFGELSPCYVLVTTPNADYNPLHGLAPGQRRHPGHHFEWGRARFRTWARALAARRGLRARFGEIGEPDADLGASTQYVEFERAAREFRTLQDASRFRRSAVP